MSAHPPPDKPHPRNVDGPFYVADGCCTWCGVPQLHADELFGVEDGHCFVKLQPRGTSRTNAMLRVMARQEFGCIRYRGDDPEIERRLADSVRRDHVSFRAATLGNTLQIVRSLASYLRSLEARFRTTSIDAPKNDLASFSVCWFEEDWHRVEAVSLEAPGAFLVRHFAPVGFSDTLCDWLCSTPEFSDIRWQSEDEWRCGGAWQATPW